MPFVQKVKRRKSNGGSGGSASQSWVYGLLCLGLIGFFWWMFWNSNHESKAPPQRAKKAPQAEPIRLEKAQYAVVSSALKEFAQVSEKIKNMEPVSAAPAPTNPAPSFVITKETPVKVREASIIKIAETPVKAKEAPVKAQEVSTRVTETPIKVTEKQEPVQAKENPPTGPRPVETVLEAQIVMTRLGISSGSIDGRMGAQTRLAVIAYQKAHNLRLTGYLDSSTKSNMLLSAPTTGPYFITTNDLGSLAPVPKTWLEKSEQPRLGFENILELLGEKSHSHPSLVKSLNQSVDWTNITAGTRVVLPSAEYPPVSDKAAIIRISLANRTLEAFDENTNLLVHFPCSIGHLAEKRPVGELKVESIIPNPNYTFDPAVFPESEEAKSIGRKLILPPGPNNPVGVAWIGLNRPGYGIHGTPGPEQVGRTESHGCFRLANWNAQYLLRLVWIGMPIQVDP